MILAGRLLLLVAVAVAVVAVVLADRGDPAAAAAPTTAYRCPMHAGVATPGPGVCPICSMTLTAETVSVKDGALINDTLTITLPKEQTNVAGVQVAAVQRLPVVRQITAPAWLEADGSGTAMLYRDELLALDAEQPAVFGPGDVAVRLLRDRHAAWDDATVAVRIVPAEAVAGGARRPAATGWVSVTPRNRGALLVPASAVLRSREGPYVLVVGGWGGVAPTFSKRPVQLGRSIFGFVAVLAGVGEGDRVAVGSTFFVDAERRRGAAVAGAGTALP